MRPVDHEAREVVAGELARTVVVEAGAGSGKTTAIVDRLVALVLTGTPIESIVAVTFTEAAAADLRARLREALEGVAAEGGADAEPARAALTNLDDATVGTVHSWARRIVAEFPSELGVPPRFEVHDEVQASIDRNRSWRDLLAALLDDPAMERAIAALDAAGYRLSQLRDAFEVLNDHLDRLDGFESPEPGASGSIRVHIDPVVEAIEVAVGFAPGCTDPADKLLTQLGILADAAHRLRVCTDDLDQLEILYEGWADRGRNLGRAASWPDKPAVVAALEAVGVAVHTARRDTLEVAVAAVVERVVDHVRRQAVDRRRAGELHFTDLLVCARELLRTSGRARRRLRDTTSVVLIDEFQDTDPIQIELAVLVATDVDEPGDTPWWELPVPAGRLVVVGDPKQSIYRFRRADLGVFRRVLDIHAENRVAFHTNFRSRPGILAWVDACIGEQLAAGAAADPRHQADPEPLVAYRGPDDDHPPVLLIGDEHDAPLAEVRAREADDVAALLRQVAAGRFPVERRDGSLRAARLGDVTILLPTRITLPYLEHALARADIPMRIESETLVLGTEAVRELVVLLEAIVDPNDTVAVVAALRTAALACRDDELARHALAGGRWHYLAPSPEGSPPSVRRGFATLRELHEMVPTTSVDGAVEHVIRAGRLLELGVAHRRPRDHWRRILHIADLARAFAEAGGASLREFVGWLRDRAEHELRTVEVPVPEPDDDAVRVLTVHGAKGLEFPITVLTGLNVLDRTAPSAVLWRDDHVPVLTGSGVRPEDYSDIFEAEKAATAAEAVRLLYVAATRARDHLIVSVHRSSGPCPAQRLAEASGHAPELWRPWQDHRAVPIPKDPIPEGMGTGEIPDLERWAVEHEAALARGRGRAAIAATTLAAIDEPEPDAQAPSHRRGRAGTAIGRAVHATLQFVDLATGAGLDAAARAQAFAEGAPELEDEVRMLAASALAAPTVRAAVAAGRFWREVPVGARVDDVVIEGFVDLLVETPEGLVVVDYKTDKLGDAAEIESRMRKYRVQGAAYALGLQATLGRPVTRCVFVFTAAEGPIEHDVADLPGALEEARRRLTTVG